MSKSHPVVLAVDTAGESTAVAVVAGDRLAERIGPGGSAVSRALLPLIDETLVEAGVDLSDVDAIAFCAGPGSFTGVRTAAAVAKGLAFARGCPVVAVGSLELLAHRGAQSTDAEWIAPLIDARMGEVYFAGYQRKGERLVEVVAPSVAAPADAAAALDRCGGQALFLVGNPGLLAGECEWRGGSLAMDVDPAALARYALTKFRAGEMTDADGACPVYVRDKVALTTAEREAARAGVTAL